VALILILCYVDSDKALTWPVRASYFGQVDKVGLDALKAMAARSRDPSRRRNFALRQENLQTHSLRGSCESYRVERWSHSRWIHWRYHNLCHSRNAADLMRNEASVYMSHARIQGG